MNYTQGQKVRMSREKLALTTPVHTGDICIIHRAEGFGSYILENPAGETALGKQLFSASEDDFEAVQEQAELEE